MSTPQLSQTRRPTASASLDLTLLACVLGLVFIANPVLGAIDGSLGDATSGAALFFSVIVVASRANRYPWIVFAVIAFGTAYALSTFATPYTDQGIRHTISLLTAAGALLVCATYGHEMIQRRWFRGSAYLIAIVGVVATWASDLQKNITGGTILYLIAIPTVIILARAGSRARLLLVLYFAAATLLGFALDFRGLIGYALILVLAYIGAATLPKPAFWVVGIVGAAAVIGGTIWYFLNVRTSELAVTITRLVIDTSGRPATSGRDWLWPSIAQIVEYSPWTGIGAGALPRDVLPTTLSAHSYYMQVYLQLGFIGIVLLVLLLLTIWGPLVRSTTPAGRFAAAVFLMFVCHNATEVLMFQNGLMAGLPAWSVIGLGIAVSRATPSDETTEAPAFTEVKSRGFVRV